MLVYSSKFTFKLFAILLINLLWNCQVGLAARGKASKGKKGSKSILQFSGIKEFSRISAALQVEIPGVRREVQFFVIITNFLVFSNVLNV